MNVRTHLIDSQPCTPGSGHLGVLFEQEIKVCECIEGGKSERVMGTPGRT